MRQTRKLDPKTAAAHTQAAKSGCADPNGFARWTYDEATQALVLRGRRVRRARSTEEEEKRATQHDDRSKGTPAASGPRAE
jgi:hypothetical protein